MSKWIEPRSRLWAGVAVIGGIGLLLGLELIEEPDASALDLLFELVEIAPIVLTSVGVTLISGPALRSPGSSAVAARTSRRRVARRRR